MVTGKHYSKGSQHPVLPEDGKIVVYSMRFCPYAQRAHLVLDAKGIPYHTVFINLSEKPEWLTEKSPLGKVPALLLPSESGSPTIIESLIIAEYLDEKYPQRPLYPRDPLQKAKDKILIERFSAVTGAFFKIVYQGADGAPAGALTDFANALDLYENELNERGTPFFGGKQPAMLDFMIWPWCERSDMLKFILPDKYDLDEKRFPKLIKWRSLMQQDPAVKKFYVSGEDHAKFLTKRRAGSHQEAYDLLAL